MLLLPVWFYWIKENPISCQKLHRNFLRHFLSFNTDNTMSTMSMQPQNTKSRSAWEVGSVAGTKLHIRSTSKKEALALNTYLTYSSALYCGLWANWLHLSQFTYWLLNYYGSGEKSGLVTHQWGVDYYLLDVDRCYWGGQTERVFSSAQAWILHSFTHCSSPSLRSQQTTNYPSSSVLTAAAARWCCLSPGTGSASGSRCWGSASRGRWGRASSPPCRIPAIAGAEALFLGSPSCTLQTIDLG